MNEIDKTKLSEQTKFTLDEIKKIENYFNPEINPRKLCSKKLSKYVTTFNSTDKILIVLNATTGGVCIINRNCLYRYCSYRIASAGFTIVFSLATRIIKKIIKNNKKKKKEKA